MKYFFTSVLLLFGLNAFSADAPQGTSMRATNGIGFGVTTIAGRLVGTNNTGSNYVAGTLNVRSNIATAGSFSGNASGVSNAVELVAGTGLAITQTTPRSFTFASTDVGFTNLPFQDLSISLNAFGDSIVSGDLGLPSWVYVMKTNLDDSTEVINFGGAGYQQHNITAAFLGSGGHTNEPYFMEVAFNGYTANPTVDGSNRLYFIRVAVSNTPSPGRFLLLQMPNDQSSSNSTARFAFTTNLNAQIAALYPNNYYAWWDWFKMQTNGSAQDDADFAAGVPPSSLMNSDGIHPNSEGNRRLGTNMAGVWRAYLRSYQEPLLTGDIPTLFRSLTNESLNLKNLVLGSSDFFVTPVFAPDFGNIKMGTNSFLFWEGNGPAGGIGWRSYTPGFLRTITVDPASGDLLFKHSGILDATFDAAGNVIMEGTAYLPTIQLGSTDTSPASPLLQGSAVGSSVASVVISTRGATAQAPRAIFTTADSGTPGVGQLILTNTDLNIWSGFTAYGNAAGMSNAVTLIASGCIQITTNADGRTFTLSISGSGADVLTNNRAGATLVGLTLTGPTTNTAQSVPNWYGGLWGTNPATAAQWILTNGTFLATSTIKSTNTTTANTALTMNGAASGSAAAVISFDTNNVNKFKVDNAGAVTTAGGITTAGDVQVGVANNLGWSGRVQMKSPSTSRIRFLDFAGPGAQLEAASAILTNGVVVSSNSWVTARTLAEGDNWYVSSNGIPHVIWLYGGVLTTNRLVP